MKNSYMGLVLATQSTKEIRGLTKSRAIATIPFGGRYRILDFALTSLTRGGVKNVGIVIPNDGSRSLRDHVRGGQFWDLNRKDGGIFFLSPTDDKERFKLNLDNLKNNIEYLKKSKEENVIIYPSNLVANIDIKKIIEAHEESGKDLTIVYKSVEKTIKEYKGCTTIIKEDEKLRFGIVVNAEEITNVSLDIKIIKKSLLIDLLKLGLQGGLRANLNSIIETNIDKISTNLYEYEGYGRFIKSTQNYFTVNKDLLNKEIRFDLLSANGGISTKINDTPPAIFEVGSKVSNSLIANGCKVKGEIKNSIIGRRVVIGKGAKIENSIILQSCTIEDGAEIKNVIIDKNVTVGNLQQVIGTEEFPLVVEKKSNFED